MGAFRILNSRKRAIIALVHSFAFGLLAFYQLIINHHPAQLLHGHPDHLVGAAILSGIYLIVTTVLLVLVGLSRGTLEKLYFGCCATSAGVGLLRVLFGDPTLYAGNLVRVFMLGCAVLAGTLILRLHSETQSEFAG